MHEEAGHLEAAADAYARAVELAPCQPTYHWSLASALARGHEPARAAESLARALRLAPEMRSLLPGFAEFAPLLDHPDVKAPR